MTWWKEGIVYQIYPRSFMDTTGNGVGDLRGIIEKLDYLKDLGVDIVWLNPVYQSPNDDNGYDISDYDAISPEFGSEQDFDDLLAGLHDRGIRLLMDLVVNHSSDEHDWFTQSRQSKDSPYRDFYFWRDGLGDEPPNNWHSVFSGSAWQYDEPTQQYYLHLFSKKQPDLNWGNSLLRKEIYAMMRRWLERGVDGFRLDVINMISKVPGLPAVSGREKLAWGGQYFMNGPKLHDYLQEMNKEVFQHYDCMTVGECFDVDVEQANKLVGQDRHELNMIFQMEHMALDHGPNGKWDVQPSWSRVELKKILRRWTDGLENTGWGSQFWMNHDQPRAVSRFGDDQNFREMSAKTLATLTLTLPGTPYIYMGEEIGMTNVTLPIEDYRDLETLNWFEEKSTQGFSQSELLKSIHSMSRDNARTPMQWCNQLNAGFSAGSPWLKVNPNYSEINVQAAVKHPESIWYWYQELIRLRKQNKILVYGKTRWILESHDQIVGYYRVDEAQEFLVLMNFSSSIATYNSQELELNPTWQLLMSNNGEPINGNEMLPWQSCVYRRDKHE